MTSDVLSQFSSFKPRETAGSSSSNRFDYQKNWSICHFLNLHETGKDFLIIFDHHEDIVTFNHSLKPDSACFYQIKSKKSGSWTVSSLAKCKDGQHDSSILRKLYTNYENFSGFAIKLAFISNQFLSIKDKGSGKKSLVSYHCFEHMHVDEKEKFSRSIEKKEKQFSDLFGLNLFEFEKSSLVLEDHVVHTKGRLAEFFENNFPSETINIGLAYKTIFDEVKRKTNFEHMDHPQDNVLTRKGLSKQRFDEMLTTIVGQRSNSELWVEASQMLLAEKCNALMLKGIKKAWDKVLVDEMNAANETFQKISRTVRIAVQEECGSQNITICSLAGLIISRLDETEKQLFDTLRIIAMICREVTRNEPLQEACEESEEQEL